MNTPRRPLVPGPSDPQPTQQGIAQRAIELREQQRMSPQLEQREVRSGLVQMPMGIVAPEPLSAVGPVGNIAGAISSIMAQVGHIKKSGYNAFHRYHYVTMGDLLEAITPLMGQAGLAIVQDEIEIKNIEGNRVAVLYEFSIFHKSGEMWPKRPRHTGMAIARDSKGNWDDKAVSKAHTNARKYFLMALFQVPAGDFDDVDESDANQRQERRSVPGPKEQEQKSTSREAGPAEQVSTGPFRISLGQGAGPDQWAGAYIRAITSAASEAEIKQWDVANDQTLQSLSEKYPGVYEQIEAAVTRRLSDLNGSMPNPKPDAQEAMNWVANQLQRFLSYQEAETFWNQKVAPHESEFEIVDWELLMKEWQRTEQRFATT